MAEAYASFSNGRKFKVGRSFRVELNNAEFQKIRKASRLESILRVRGETWCARLNSELHKAQRARKQPIADGYTFYIHSQGSRLRLYIVAFTARAQAHERKHSSILKLMETTKYDVKLQAHLTAEQRLAGAHAAQRARHERRARSSRDRAGDA